MKFQFDGLEYRLSLSAGSFEEDERVRYSESMRTFEIDETLKPPQRLSRLGGEMLRQFQLMSYQKAVTPLLFSDTYTDIKLFLGAGSERSEYAYKLITKPLDLDARFGAAPAYTPPRVVEPGGEGLVVLKAGNMVVPFTATWLGLSHGSDSVIRLNDTDEALDKSTYRCLVPATGWFNLRPREPMLYMSATSSLVAFAGICEELALPYGRKRTVYTILADTPEDGSSPMPALLSPDEVGPWLDMSLNTGELIEQVCAPWPRYDFIRLPLA
ncbi:MAG: SOS response-associated peptidase family protein [Phycisphaerales bacterium]